MSHFQALYGRVPPTIPKYTRGSTLIQALDEDLTAREDLLRTLKSNLFAAQNRMANKTNMHRRELSFNVGDMVLECLQPYHQLSIAEVCHHKLRKCYYGPYPILEHIIQVAYRVGLPATLPVVVLIQYFTSLYSNCSVGWLLVMHVNYQHKLIGTTNQWSHHWLCVSHQQCSFRGLLSDKC